MEKMEPERPTSDDQMVHATTMMTMKNERTTSDDPTMLRTTNQHERTTSDDPTMLRMMNQHEPTTSDGYDPHNANTLMYRQRTALGNVTKSKNRLEELMKGNAENLDRVKLEFERHAEFHERYQEIYEKHLDLLPRENKESAKQSISANETSIANFKRDVIRWMNAAENTLFKKLDNRSIRSASAASRSSRMSGSRRSSQSSSSTRLKEKMRLAELKVEEQYLVEQQEIDRRKKAMEIKMEIAKAQARCDALDEFEADYYENIDCTPQRSNKQTNSSTVITKPNAQENVRDSTNCVRLNQMHLPPMALQPDLDLRPVKGISVNNREHIQETYMPTVSTDIGYCPSNKPQSDDSKNAPVTCNSGMLPIQTPTEAILEAHRCMASAMHLPAISVPKFNGNPMEYTLFIKLFETRIIPFLSRTEDKLLYLEQLLEGDAKDLVGGCLYMDPSDGYTEARKLLDLKYGDSFKITTSYINQLKNWPTLLIDDNRGIEKLSNFLTKCHSAMKGIQALAFLDHTQNIQAVIEKLPKTLQIKWAEKVDTLLEEKLTYPSFADLRDFINKASRVANNPAYGQAALHERNSKNKPQSFTAQINVEETPRNQNSVTAKCEVCQQRHDIRDCKIFLDKSLQNRKEFLKQNDMCFGCLGLNHTSKGCLKKHRCMKCGRRHPTVLHDPEYDDAGNKTHVESSAQVHIETDTEVVLEAIVPVRIKQSGQEKTITTYALLDTGSTGCFLTEALRQELQAQSENTTIKLKSVHGTLYSDTTVSTGLIITDMDGNNPVELPKTYSRDEIPVSHEQIPKPEAFAQWPHLKALSEKLPRHEQKVEIGLLIGNNCPQALQPIEVIPTTDNGPFAVRYKHGWTINGPCKIATNEDCLVSCNRILIKEVSSFAKTVLPAEIPQMMEQDFSERDIGCEPGECAYSQEDETFMENAKTGLKFVNGSYELPLPYRDDQPSLENNKQQALKRALWQKKKLAKDEKYHEDNCTFINKLLDIGYAYQVPDDELTVPSNNLRYLPHHGVYHPTKGKMRGVFDCSAKYHGQSLNDALLSGPDLTNTLVGVLTRFRLERYTYAFIADIESMFYQVKVPRHQHSFLRFSWWPDGNLDSELEEYCMSVHIFGAASSSSLAWLIAWIRQLFVSYNATHFKMKQCRLPLYVMRAGVIRSTNEAEQSVNVIQGVVHWRRWIHSSMPQLR